MCLKELRRRMFWTNIFFHAVRNTPRHREQYYFALISMVGYSKWQTVDDTIRMNWESARVSFDRMYGMVKDFAIHPEEYKKIFSESTVQPKKEENTDNGNKELTDKINSIFEKIKSTNDKLTELNKIVPVVDQIKELRDNLNKWSDSLDKWIPPET